MTILYTKRLMLRPWREDDAEALYRFAKDPSVGPVAGWPVHKDVEDSRNIIRDVLSAPETYALCLKGTDTPIGCVGLTTGAQSNLTSAPDEGEIGYWIGVPFWGQGLVPEAVRALIARAFTDLGLTALWCGYFEGNDKSRRAQEKCGFTYDHTRKDIYWALTEDIRTEHVTRLSRVDWQRVNANDWAPAD